MKLQQLRFLTAIVQSELNITAAAAKMATTQPAISKQLKLLEDELGFNIFSRSGRTLTGVTQPGSRVVTCALRMLREAQNIKDISEEFRYADIGTMSIGTTHTQARYVLPPVIQKFRQRYPKVQFHLHQGTSEQISEMGKLDRIDFAIATGSQELFGRLILLPCYRWHRRIVVPKGHYLAGVEKPSLSQLAGFPIITYVFSFSGPSSLHDAFAKEGLRADIALTARDSDIIKTYVRLGLGVGILAGLSVSPVDDADLVSIDASHLFPAHTTWIGFTRGGLLRSYMYDFLLLFAPHLTRRVVDRATQCETQAEVDALFADTVLPVR